MNYPKIAISTKNKNFKPLPVLKMIYFDIVTPHKLCFVIKIRVCATSYDNQFRKNEYFPQRVKISLIIHENDVITFSNLKKVNVS